MAVRDRRVNAMEIDLGLVNANGGGVPERGNLHLAGNSTLGGYVLRMSRKRPNMQFIKSAEALDQIQNNT